MWQQRNNVKFQILTPPLPLVESHAMDTSRLVAVLGRKPCLYPQLTEFFQTEIKQIDQSRYITPSHVCVQHDRTCRSSSEAEGWRWISGAHPPSWYLPYKLLLSALRVSKTTASEPHQLHQKGAWRRFPHLQRAPSLNRLHFEGNFPASECIEGLWLTASPHPNFTSLKRETRETGATSWSRGFLRVFSFSSEHLWKGNNFSALHCLSASSPALPLPFRKWLREWGLILNRDHHFCSSDCFSSRI